MNRIKPRYTQLQNPVTKHWAKVDMNTGSIVDWQKEKYPNIPIRGEEK